MFTCFVFLGFFSKKNHCFIQEGNPSENVVIVQEELVDIDIDDLANLKNSPRFVLIDEECENEESHSGWWKNYQKY